MWRFSCQNPHYIAPCFYNFNTSNVTVQPREDVKFDSKGDHFNTSNVTVQHVPASVELTFGKISIHQMWRFSPFVLFNWAVRNRHFNTSNVTVQLHTVAWIRQLECISIHQMWRFSSSTLALPQDAIQFQYIKCDGSAPSTNVFTSSLFVFQYIKCDGSACPNNQKYAILLLHNKQISIHQMWRFSVIIKIILLKRTDYFNTSNVTVQLKKVSLLRRLLRYFNTSNVTVQQNQGDRWADSFVFQYIKCDGSASWPGCAGADPCNFNTSNVTVQRYCPAFIFQPLDNFNTSNVTVQL